jgi:hypothetical protein
VLLRWSSVHRPDVPTHVTELSAVRVVISVLLLIVIAA